MDRREPNCVFKTYSGAGPLVGNPSLCSSKSMKIVIFPSEAFEVYSDLSQGLNYILSYLRGDTSTSIQKATDFLDAAAIGLNSLVEDLNKASLEVFPEIHAPMGRPELVPAKFINGFELAEGCRFRVGIDRLGHFTRRYSLYTADENGVLPKEIWLENALEWLLPKIINPLAEPNRVYRVDQVNGTETFYLTQI